MAETVTIGEIANRLSEEIFSYFRWVPHPRRDDNFACHNPAHTSSGSKPKAKKTHPGDVVFQYEDPYLGRRVYLHTDLKSYAKDSVSTVKLRSAIESLAMSVECARGSPDWRMKYSVPEDEPFEIRGLLFVHNHDGQYLDDFDLAVSRTNLGTIPLAPNIYIHFLGPRDISRLYTIANDIVRLQHHKTLPEQYSFYYPDLVMWRRHGDLYRQPATIESLTSPYFIVAYEQGPKSPPGFMIYYNRPGASAHEFEYFLDSLSRYQMLEPGKLIRVRLVSADLHESYLSNFHAAKQRYIKAWGLDPIRAEILDNIVIDRVTSVATTYSSPAIGWRAK